MEEEFRENGRLTVAFMAVLLLDAVILERRKLEKDEDLQEKHRNVREISESFANLCQTQNEEAQKSENNF